MIGEARPHEIDHLARDRVGLDPKRLRRKEIGLAGLRFSLSKFHAPPHGAPFSISRPVLRRMSR